MEEVDHEMNKMQNVLDEYGSYKDFYGEVIKSTGKIMEAMEKKRSEMKGFKHSHTIAKPNDALFITDVK
jgi:hypothetical protein